MGGLLNPFAYASGHQVRPKRPDVAGARTTSKQARYRERLRVAGRCVRCGQPSAPYYCCPRCRDKRLCRQRRAGIRRRVSLEDPNLSPTSPVFRAASLIMALCVLGSDATLLEALLDEPRGWIEGCVQNLIRNGICDDRGTFLLTLDPDPAVAIITFWLMALTAVGEVQRLSDERWRAKPGR